jgi:hypothetical protein
MGWRILIFYHEPEAELVVPIMISFIEGSANKEPTEPRVPIG